MDCPLLLLLLRLLLLLLLLLPILLDLVYASHFLTDEAFEAAAAPTVTLTLTAEEGERGGLSSKMDPHFRVSFKSSSCRDCHGERRYREQLLTQKYDMSEALRKSIGKYV
jgi:hypothetical protein